jgi:hypothetical protein
MFAPPGRCLVLVTEPPDAYWVTSFPFAEYVHHAWGGAWMCSAFRNEGPHLSSELIREAVAATRWRYGDPPSLGMVTFVDPSKVRHKRDFGRCFLRAGFVPARCPKHASAASDCPACGSRTEAGLHALQLLPEAMPSAATPLGGQLELATFASSRRASSAPETTGGDRER